MTVKERLTFLFNNNILSDVTFVVGRDVHQQRIPAHRFVLSVGSAVFDAMFNRHSSKVGTSAIGEFTMLNYPTLYPPYTALIREGVPDRSLGRSQFFKTIYLIGVISLQKKKLNFRM